MHAFDFEAMMIMSEILDKTGIKIDFKELSQDIKTSKIENGQDAAALGKELVISVLGPLLQDLIKYVHRAGPEVKKLISYMTGKTHAEISKMLPKDFLAFFKELIEQEGFTDFFKSAVD